VSLTVTRARPGTRRPGGRRSRPLQVIATYVQLTKPRIVVLLLITTVPAMILAHRGIPSWWLMAATLVGGTVAAGGANAVNQYLDRDIDEVMRRTRRRPLPSHRIPPSRALIFGLVLGALSFAWLALTVNLLSAVLALAAYAFYVLVYTMWLKRTSAQNIVIGGAAGAVPALVGWAAVTGRVGAPAWVLFTVVFLWTPPHFWALAMKYERDYAAAGVPMLPVVAGRDATTLQILVYAVVLVAASLVLWPVGHMGPVYVGSAAVLGVIFVGATVRLRRHPTPAAAMRVFRLSLSYLALLFLAVAVDTVLRFGP
jgi:protoheme IX farnesyltransferase